MDTDINGGSGTQPRRFQRDWLQKVRLRGKQPSRSSIHLLNASGSCAGRTRQLLEVRYEARGKALASHNHNQERSKQAVHARRRKPRAAGLLKFARSNQANTTRNEFANLAFARTEKANQQKKDTVMKTKHNLLNKISLSLGLAVALAFASGCATTTDTGDQMKPMKGGEHQQMLNKE